MSHFAYLQTEFPSIYEAAIKAEEMALSDPRGSAFYGRRTVDLAVNWAYKHDNKLRLPYQDNLSALIHEPSFIDLAGQSILTKAKVVIRLGNQAVHSEKVIGQHDSVSSLRELTHITYWLARTYSRSGVPSAPTFDQGNLPKPIASLVKQTVDKLKAQQEQLSAKDEKLSIVLADKNRLSDELTTLREEVARAKAANANVAETHDYNEEETRDYFIDLLLKEAGWPLDQDRDREYEVQGMPNDSGNGFVDYVLWGNDGKPLAVVEAKRTRRDARVGQNQAKLYADCLENEFGQRPIIFYTNGYDNYLWDDRMHPPRLVQGFLKQDELELMIQRRTSRKVLNADDASRAIINRPYQIRAIQRVSESFQNDNRRKALLVMATGSGKTRTVIALADLLMQMNWAKRILFLADRVALVNQATNAFKEHLPSASIVNLIKNKNEEGRIYVSTYPTMMGLIDGKSDDSRRFGVGHFDLIIIDEAHRSVYQKYGAIFGYFDSYLVGLTATPVEEIDRNTYGLFDLEEGVPTDAYTLDEAIEEGWLVPPVPISVPLQFLREGIKYDERSDEEKDEWDALDWSEDGEKPDEVSADAVNRWLFNIDTVDKVIANLMSNGIKVAGGDRLGKTIIFAKNQRHADFIQERFDTNYPAYKGAFSRVITFKTEYAQDLIDKFSIADSDPQIAISVDMLDTGIDVPEVVNLVIFKLIRSKTKFWQILGRGTRLCPDLFGPGEHKSEFYIFDYCQNLEFFSQDEDRKEPGASISLAQRLFQLKLELIQAINDKDPNSNEELDGDLPTESEISETTARGLWGIVKEMSLDNFIVRSKRLYVEKYQDLKPWQEVNDIMIGEVVDHIANLPSGVTDPDEMAKRFDALCHNLQLCVLKGNKGFEKYSSQVVRIAEALIDRLEVPAIKLQLPLLQRITEEDYWTDITIPMLEVMRIRIRLLVKHIDSASREIVYTNFEDQLGPSTVVTLTNASERSLLKFRQKAKAFLNTQLDHLSLNKLRMNKPLTELDLQDLEKLFLDFGIGDEDLLKRASEQSHGLGLFIRSLVGLDKSAAQGVFSEFIDGQKLSANQLKFISLIIDYLSERGVVPVEALYQSPFTNLAPQGPDSIFEEDEVSQIVELLHIVQSRAS